MKGKTIEEQENIDEVNEVVTEELRRRKQTDALDQAMSSAFGSWSDKVERIITKIDSMSDKIDKTIDAVDSMKQRSK